ncbi:hypothetical protein AQUCO_01900134v1 [Aquilegia coerulea]|uniref:Uncharacterized protein n=1 Tax=Aquilegia coerulea TaxID=218851 RepID=A0A2G5DJ32_AQUCA|nr:hypothetical protein AQUCO_01900134v1 [Aquilegia coerulea]
MIQKMVHHKWPSGGHLCYRLCHHLWKMDQQREIKETRGNSHASCPGNGQWSFINIHLQTPNQICSRKQLLCMLSRPPIFICK